MPNLSASTILELLQAPAEDWHSAKRRIAKTAQISELLGALQQATTPILSQIVSEILGQRCAVEAVPTLISLLYDPDPGIRNEAALALGRIGDVRAGPALLERFTNSEEDKEALHWHTSALGAVGYRPAIPTLVEALDDSDPIIRGLAAWSLGIMGVVEAKERIQTAYTVETLQFARTQMKDALAALKVVSLVTGTDDLQIIEARLTRSLSSRSNTVRGAAAGAVATLQLKNMAPVLQQAIKREKACFVAARMRDALNVLE